MLELDSDLFQTIVLALGLITVVLLLLVLSGLGKIRKAVEGGGTRAASAPTPRQQEVAAQPVAAQPAVAQPVATDAATTPVDTGATATVSATSPTTETATTPVAASPEAATPATTSVGAEPQDQPFEKDGRWWFRRGSELLVYDEGSGQWLPSGGPETAPAASAPAGGTTTTTTTQPQPAADQGGWKCPSCGAINGATAASCRMCFTPRP